MTTVATLVARFMADTSSFQRGIAEVHAATTSTEGGFQKLAKVSTIAMAAVGSAFVGAGIYAVHAAGDFQEGITTLVTGAGEAEKNVGKVRDGILNLAVATATSTKQLVDGMFMIESAGYHGAQGLAVLKAAAEGAKTGNADLGVTANAVTTVMNDYHLSAKQAADATNFLVAVVSQGKTHMEDLGASLAYILPIASSLHVPLSDVGGAMATLTGHGIDAATAATYLRFTLGAIINPSSQAKSALDEIGLSSTALSSTLSQKGLVAALQLLEQHLQDHFPKGSAQATAALSEILGGVRGLGAGLGLTGDNLTEFIGKVQKTSSTIEGANGKVLGFDKTQQELNFKLAQAKEAVQTLAIRLGTLLLPVVEKVVSAVTSAVNWFDKHRTVAIALAGVIGGVLLTAVAAYTVSMITAAAATVVATWPILAIIAAVAALAAGIIFLWTHWNQVWEWITHHKAYAAIIALLAGPLDAIFALVFAAHFVADHWNDIVGGLKEAADVAIAILHTIADIGLAPLRFAIAVASDAWHFLSDAASTAAGIVMAVLGPIIGAISIIKNGLSDIIGGPSSFNASDLSPAAAVAAAQMGWLNKANGGVIHAAGGFRVPGMGDGDRVPAMLTPGEVVLSKAMLGKLGQSANTEPVHVTVELRGDLAALVNNVRVYQNRGGPVPWVKA